MLFVYVEDDAANRYIMELLFSYELDDSQLMTMEDSSDFEHRIDQFSPKPDVFLLDLHVRPLDGFEMIKVIRNHPVYQHTKVIAITASSSDILNPLMQAGFDGAISKPINRENFAHMIERIIKGDRVWYTG